MQAAFTRAPTKAPTGQPPAAPRAMCACCNQVETPALEPLCPTCRASLEASGVLKPKDPRTQIGPLDV